MEFVNSIAQIVHQEVGAPWQGGGCCCVGGGGWVLALAAGVAPVDVPTLLGVRLPLPLLAVLLLLLLQLPCSY